MSSGELVRWRGWYSFYGKLGTGLKLKEVSAYRHFLVSSSSAASKRQISTGEKWVTKKWLKNNSCYSTWNRDPSFTPWNCHSGPFYTHWHHLRHLERQIMNRKGVLEPRDPHTDSQETTPLLTAYSHTENAGGSAVDGTALHRNEQDGT